MHHGISCFDLFQILLKYYAGTVNRLDQESNLEVPEVRKLFVCI